MRKNKGFTLIELMIVVSIIGILALIAIPNFQGLRQKAYNASAQASGRAGVLAQELYYQDQDSPSIGYAKGTGAMDWLLQHDQNLNETPGVTFTFSTEGQTTNFTFTTSHAKGNKTFIFHD